MILRHAQVRAPLGWSRSQRPPRGGGGQRGSPPAFVNTVLLKLAYESEFQQRLYIYTELDYLLPGLYRQSPQFLVQ